MSSLGQDVVNFEMLITHHLKKMMEFVFWKTEIVANSFLLKWNNFFTTRKENANNCLKLKLKPIIIIFTRKQERLKNWSLKSPWHRNSSSKNECCFSTNSSDSLTIFYPRLQIWFTCFDTNRINLFTLIYLKLINRFLY